MEQGLGLLQIRRIEAFGEPAVDRSEKIAGLIPFALIRKSPDHPQTYDPSASSKALASFKSTVSNPSLNQP